MLKRRIVTALLTASLGSAVLEAQGTPSATLLVLSKADRTVAIVDPATLKVLARMPSGPDPHEIVADADGKRAYVSNYIGAGGAHNTISVVDLVEHKALEPIDLGALRGPHGLDFAGGKVWFTAETNKVIGSYDPATRRVDWVLGTGQNRTHMISVSRDLNRIVTSNVSAATMSLIDKVTRPTPRGPQDDWEQTVVPVGKGAEGFDVAPDGKQIWAANAQDGTVSVLDAADKKVVDTLNVNVRGANRLKFTPDGALALVSTLGGPELVIVDAKTRRWRSGAAPRASRCSRTVPVPTWPARRTTPSPSSISRPWKSWAASTPASSRTAWPGWSGARNASAASPSSVGDSESLADVPRTLQLVEDRDRVVFERDEALARRIDQELVARGPVASGPLARSDLGRRAEERPIEPLSLRAPHPERLASLQRFGLVRLRESGLVDELLSGRDLEAARATDEEDAFHVRAAEAGDDGARVLDQGRCRQAPRVRPRRDGADHRVGALDALGDAVRLRGVTLHQPDARVGRRRGRGVSNDADDLVATAQRFRRHAPSHVSRRSEQDDLHDFDLRSTILESAGTDFECSASWASAKTSPRLPLIGAPPALVT
jgi:YVTN family beta-propeller protein